MFDYKPGINTKLDSKCGKVVAQNSSFWDRTK